MVHNSLMARPRTQTNAEIFPHVLTALVENGEKALTFGSLAQRCGLAPATLAQRFGTVDQMICAALGAEWDRLSQALSQAEAEAMNSAKGAQALLKTLPCPDPSMLAYSLRHETLRETAAAWRAQVEAALAARRGGGTKGREAAALLFAAWQGRALWENGGGKGFRLSDLLKAIS